MNFEINQSNDSFKWDFDRILQCLKDGDGRKELVQQIEHEVGAAAERSE